MFTVCKKNMSDWRFHDYPLKGHWRYLPDDLSLQRGPTIVILQDGRRIRVPAMSKQNVVAPGDTHNAKDGEDMLKSLQALLSGKKQSTKPKAAQGFEMQRRVHQHDLREVGGRQAPVRESIHDARVQGAVGPGPRAMGVM